MGIIQNFLRENDAQLENSQDEKFFIVCLEENGELEFRIKCDDLVEIEKMFQKLFEQRFYPTLPIISAFTKWFLESGSKAIDKVFEIKENKKEGITN